MGSSDCPARPVDWRYRHVCDTKSRGQLGSSSLECSCRPKSKSGTRPQFTVPAGRWILKRVCFLSNRQMHERFGDSIPSLPCLVASAGVLPEADFPSHSEESSKRAGSCHGGTLQLPGSQCPRRARSCWAHTELDFNGPGSRDGLRLKQFSKSDLCSSEGFLKGFDRYRIAT